MTHATSRSSVVNCALACLLLWRPDAGAAGEAESRVGPRRAFSETVLVRDGQSACVVVYPSGRPEYRALVTQVESVIHEVSGVRPRVLMDTEATLTEHPVLREEWKDVGLILLGRLGINRAVWPSLVRRLFFCPKKGGSQCNLWSSVHGAESLSASRNGREINHQGSPSPTVFVPPAKANWMKK